MSRVFAVTPDIVRRPNPNNREAASTQVGAALSFRKDQIMHASAQTKLHSFTVDVEFSSGGQPYATETYKVEASDWYRAQRDALEMSVLSAYDNVRIPNLTRRVIV